MKKTLLVYVFFAVVFSASAQWKTLYEGGFGTPVELRHDWGHGFYIDPVDPAYQHYASILVNQNGFGQHVDFSPDPNRIVMAFIFRQIPEMEYYTSLRIYLDVDLPDSMGTIYYHKFKDPTSFALINPGPPFASDISSSWVYFSNTEGDNTIILYSLFDISPAAVMYNYIRVEADVTTSILDIPAEKPEFTVFSSGKELHIQPSQADVDYEVQLVDLSGKCIYQDQKKGQQHIPLDCSTGIYFVKVTQNERSYEEKIYLE